MWKQIKLSRLLLTAAPILLFSNTTVSSGVQPNHSVVLNDQSNQKTNLPEWQKTMYQLLIKYQNNPKYSSLNAREKDQLFDVQAHLFQSLGYNPYFRFQYSAPSSDNRYFNKWWGANLWVNLTVHETKHWINLLHKNYSIGPGVSLATDLVSKATDDVVTGNGDLDFLIKIVHFFTAVGNFINQYFDWSYLSEIAKKGHGAISYRFTFGFIPSGVFPAYKVVK